MLRLRLFQLLLLGVVSLSASLSFAQVDNDPANDFNELVSEDAVATHCNLNPTDNRSCDADEGECRIVIGGYVVEDPCATVDECQRACAALGGDALIDFTAESPDVLRFEDSDDDGMGLGWGDSSDGSDGSKTLRDKIREFFQRLFGDK